MNNALATTQPEEDEDEDLLEEEGDDEESILAKLVLKKKTDHKRSVAYKTVEMFSGITKRRLWLKDAGDGNPTTDGNELRVPFSDPEFYRKAEHLLAHVLFRTDVKARDVFVKEYTDKVKDVAAKQNVDIKPDQLKKAVRHMVNVLEGQRVASLWGLLYPGSAQLMREMHRHEAEPFVPEAHTNLLTFFTLLANGIDVPPGDLDRFRPYMLESLKKVERRGFVATLATAKWLVTNIVSEILRQMRDMPPPPPHPSQGRDEDDEGEADGGQQQPQDAPSSFGMQKSDPNRGGQKQQGKPQKQQARGGSGGGSGSNPEDEEEGTDQSGDESDGDEGADGSGGGESPEQDQKDDGSDGEGGGSGEDEESEEPWRAPGAPPNASVKDRAEALKDAVNKIGGMPDKIQNQMDPVTDSKYSKRNDQQRAQDLANQALGLDVTKEDKLDDLLEGTEKDMQDLVEAAKAAMRQTPHEDEWLQRDAMAKVVFKDVKRSDEAAARSAHHAERTRVRDRYAKLAANTARNHYEQMEFDRLEDAVHADQSEAQTVQRLRALFYRVMGKRKATLADSGTEIDIPAYIACRQSGIMEPCFKSEERGQGFKAMLLLDKSGSMMGDKDQQVERAARIISKALRFPFVDLQIWGFQSHEAGSIQVIRYEKNMEFFNVSKASSGGMTPLHIAMRLGSRQMEKGTEKKQLFVLTDGFPVHYRRDGRMFDTNQLMMFCREEVHSARQQGIGVTGILVGNGYGPNIHYDMSPKQLKFMFGAPRFWKTMAPGKLSQDLVKLVASSFVDYLKAR
jgi:hypothetical protein